MDEWIGLVFQQTKKKRIGLANGTGIAESCHGNNVRLPGRRCEAVCTQDVQKYGAWLLTSCENLVRWKISSAIACVCQRKVIQELNLDDDDDD